MRTRPAGPHLAPRADLDVRAPASRRFLQVLDEGRARGQVAGGAPSGAPPPPQVPDAQRPSLRPLLLRTLDGESRLDRLIAQAGAGRTFSAGQLLALQATAFRYSQTVEVLSRATDRLVGALKQAMGTQV